MVQNLLRVRETLNTSTFCGEPEQLCDAGPGNQGLRGVSLAKKISGFI
jgi:hypothetical protein